MVKKQYVGAVHPKEEKNGIRLKYSVQKYSCSLRLQINKLSLILSFDLSETNRIISKSIDLILTRYCLKCIAIPKYKMNFLPVCNSFTSFTKATDKTWF